MTLETETVEVEPEQGDSPTPDPTPDDTETGSGDAGEGGDTAAEGSTDRRAAKPNWDSELITAEDFESLKGDPDKLLKHFNGAYTKKTQALAEQRKFVEALQANPHAVLQALAQRLGRTISEAPKPKDEMLEVRSELAELFGEGAADKMMPAIEKVANKIVERQVGPLTHTVQAQVIAARAEQAEAVMGKMTDTFPDWKQHEDKITALASKYPPAPGTDAFEYLSSMYKLATYDSAEGEGSRRAIQRMQRAAGVDKTTGSVPGTHVSTSPRGNPTFREAYEAAKKGNRFAD